MAESAFTVQTPTIPDVFENTPVTLATALLFGVNGYVTHGRFFAPLTIGAGTFEIVLFLPTAEDAGGGGAGIVLATAMFSSLAAGAWNTVAFTSPVAVTAGVFYKIAIRTSEGRYTATGGYFDGVSTVNGNVAAVQNLAFLTGFGAVNNGSYQTNLTGYPNQTFNSNCYFTDVLFEAGGTGGSITTGSASTLPAGAAATFAAGGQLVAQPAGTLPAAARSTFTVGGQLAARPASTTPAGAAAMFAAGVVLNARPAVTLPSGTTVALRETSGLTAIPAATLPGSAAVAFLRGDSLVAIPAGTLPAGAIASLRRGDVLTGRPAGTFPGASVITLAEVAPSAGTSTPNPPLLTVTRARAALTTTSQEHVLTTGAL